jgi:hypothetical protein
LEIEEEPVLKAIEKRFRVTGTEVQSINKSVNNGSGDKRDTQRRASGGLDW